MSPAMNSITDTLGTLLPDARKLAGVILKQSRFCFETDGEVLPCAFFVTADGQPSIVGVPELSDETKPSVWAMVAHLRRTHPITAFVSEVWVAHCDKSNMNPDGTVKVMPRNDPNKTECIMIVLWQGKRHVSFTADITRNPTNLGEWKVMFDSEFPVKNGITEVGGNMMKGEDYPMEAN